MNKGELIQAIKNKVGSNYTIWTIGITDDPETRKNQHENDGKNVKYWSHWKTDFESVGREVEKYFLDLGMKGDTGGGGSARYVYVF
ncbi:MAG: hypothetical protein JXB17_13745 [Bacteroidales bacterium]|nr:hypothetical protein [Bacteroidales bacterium]